MTRQFIKVERTLTQTEFDLFAKLSGDDNPIHIDPVFSAATRFGRTVAHGMLLSSVFRGLLHQLSPKSQFLDHELMFPAPTFAGEPMKFSVQIVKGDSGATSAIMRCTRIADDVVTCTAKSRLTIGGTTA